MPRLPVDGEKVIEYRISLSGVEREQLENLVMGITANRVLTPIVTLLNDPTGLLALAGLLEALGIIDIMAWVRSNPWAEGVIEGIESGAYASYEAALAALLKAAETINEAEESYEAVVTAPVKIWTWIKLSYATYNIGRGP